MKKYNIAVVGATGVVGETMIRVLEERKFPINELRPLASVDSKGRKIKFAGKEISVQVLNKDSFKDIHFALFSAGASVSMEFAPVATSAGAIVIDNTSAFRMYKDVDLVVPEVNGDLLNKKKAGGYIIANPNCSTIQLVCVLKPIHDVAKIKRVVVSTYQAVSGAGKDAILELVKQSEKILDGKKDAEMKVFPHQIAFNCLPHIDVFEPNGYTKEEMKVANETKKIMRDESIAVTCTAVRVPVFNSHSESVNIETEKKISATEIRKILAKAEGVTVVDDPVERKYPLAINAAGRDEVFVGRIREDYSIKNGINLWIVSDNVRKGAATNAVQIAELLI